MQGRRFFPAGQIAVLAAGAASGLPDPV